MGRYGHLKVSRRRRAAHVCVWNNCLIEAAPNIIERRSRATDASALIAMRCGHQVTCVFCDALLEECHQGFNASDVQQILVNG